MTNSKLNPQEGNKKVWASIIYKYIFLFTEISPKCDII